MNGESETKPIHYFIALIIMVVVGIIIWNWWNGLGNSTESSSNTDDLKMEAYVFSQSFIKDYLKKPSTAKFPVYNKINVVQTNNRYKVEAYVESQNEFGTTIKTDYYMILEKTEDGGWSKISCDLK